MEGPCRRPGRPAGRGPNLFLCKALGGRRGSVREGSWSSYQKLFSSWKARQHPGRRIRGLGERTICAGWISVQPYNSTGSNPWSPLLAVGGRKRWQGYNRRVWTESPLRRCTGRRGACARAAPRWRSTRSHRRREATGRASARQLPPATVTGGGHVTHTKYKPWFWVMGSRYWHAFGSELAVFLIKLGKKKDPIPPALVAENQRRRRGAHRRRKRDCF